MENRKIKRIMTNSKHSSDPITPVIHKQLILYLKNSEINTFTYIIGYFHKDNQYTFESLKSNRRFLFDQKYAILIGLQSNSKKVFLFKYSDEIKQDVLVNSLETLKTFRANLKTFELILEDIYIFNVTDIVSFKLDN